MNQSFTKVGQILRSQGIQGELKVEIDPTFEKEFFSQPHFFILINGDFVPYFVEFIQDNKFVTVKFEEIDNPEGATKLSHKDIFMRKKDITSTKYLKDEEKHSLVGFYLYNEDQPIGLITSVEIYPKQLMGFVSMPDKEILIPLVESWIVRIDSKNKKVFMLLPQGITNL